MRGLWGLWLVACLWFAMCLGWLGTHVNALESQINKGKGEDVGQWIGELGLPKPQVPGSKNTVNTDKLGGKG